MKLNTAKLIRAAFKTAADRASLPLHSNILDSLARKIIFSLHLNNHASGKPKTFLSNLSLPLRTAEAAAWAVDLRYTLDIGDIDPFFHLPDIIADKLNVLVFTLEESSIGGACTLIDGTAFIFLPAGAEVGGLYACARHLGYLLTAPVRKTRGIFAIFESSTKSVHLPSGPYERFADFFALELLVPTRGLGIALKEVRNIMHVSSGAIGDIELLYVSRIFGVSFLEIARRCERATLLPKGGAAALYQFLVDKFGGPEARAKALELPPRPITSILPVPRRILSATANQIRKGSLSAEHAAIELGCPAGFLDQTLHLLSTSH